jgi:hypothetical protein
MYFTYRVLVEFLLEMNPCMTNEFEAKGETLVRARGLKFFKIVVEFPGKNYSDRIPPRRIITYFWADIFFLHRKPHRKKYNSIKSSAAKPEPEEAASFYKEQEP